MKIPTYKSGYPKIKKGMKVKMKTTAEMGKMNFHPEYMKYNFQVAGKTVDIKRVIVGFDRIKDSFEVEGYKLYRDHSGFDALLIKSIVKTPEIPKPPLKRILHEGSTKFCPVCGSTYITKYKVFYLGIKKIEGCIQPECKLYNIRIL